jgi:hypothetical protein
MEDREMLGEKKGQGYVGKKMSVNAALAYQNEEKPISKWTKKKMTEWNELID